MWFKGMIVIGFAMFIDFLMIIFAFIFESMGAALCWNSSTGVIYGLLKSAACGTAGAAVGALASAIGIPLGTALTMVSDICISLTFGAGFMVLIFLMGYFRGNTLMIFGTYIGKTIPFLDVVPGYTALAIRCVLKNNLAQSVLAGAGVASAISSGNPLSIVRTVSSIAGAGQRMSGQPRMPQRVPREERSEQQPPTHTLPELKSPSLVPTLNGEIRQRQPHVQTA
jgi:hypothetical protein